IRSELREMLANGIRLNVIGNMDRFDASIQRLLKEAMKETALNDAMVLNLALSYGGRDEIVMAAQRIASDVKNGLLTPQQVDHELFARYLYTAGMPDPDLFIRTSGEYRLSNFLIWQCAYTEFYFTEVLWPDFTKEHLLEAIAEYQRRERRFGLTSEQLKR
ncbi:MAG: polyprenyl diphosphate synthase, partial [Syntrophales bacterium]|nr:polyprenyl diphosphate synthase [Syntrophales bacterium]